MKKIITIVFCLFYLGTVSGININLHYCGSKLKSISLFENKDDKGCCKKKNKKCCHQKTTFVKVKDKHQSVSTFNFTSSTFNSEVAVLPEYLVVPVYATDHFQLFNYHAPPLLYKNPIYLRNSVLII